MVDIILCNLYYIETARDGGWSEWGNWTGCSAPCDNGFEIRSRDCNNPIPAHDGKYCSGVVTNIQECKIKNCRKLSVCSPLEYN